LPCRPWIGLGDVALRVEPSGRVRIIRHVKRAGRAGIEELGWSRDGSHRPAGGDRRRVAEPAPPRHLSAALSAGCPGIQPRVPWPVERGPQLARVTPAVKSARVGRRPEPARVATRSEPAGIAPPPELSGVTDRPELPRVTDRPELPRITDGVEAVSASEPFEPAGIADATKAAGVASVTRRVELIARRAVEGLRGGESGRVGIRTRLPSLEGIATLGRPRTLKSGTLSVPGPAIAAPTPATHRCFYPCNR
jgi:hypothetical protein